MRNASVTRNSIFPFVRYLIRIRPIDRDECPCAAYELRGWHRLFGFFLLSSFAQGRNEMSKKDYFFVFVGAGPRRGDAYVPPRRIKPFVVRFGLSKSDLVVIYLDE